ncbi:mCG1030674, isoform CRA_b [Mus musculus]|nr:mCG1030674, isoform CRA_b [Mus musculus]
MDCTRRSVSLVDPEATSLFLVVPNRAQG